ncbi:borealin-like [Rhineura floridana]|uniref:borealin-like n=1 Tax=Rhineura floridana TaxID=261503 RepID=UPI002AC81707|nr:borealin-like [Rhineura floridana]
MAPRKKTTRGASKNSVKSKKVDAFLKDFDREVNARIDQARVDGENLLKEIENLYDMEIFRFPMAVREMNWLSYLAAGGSEQALQKVASADSDILEITKLASEAIQTPVKTTRKAAKVKQAIETIDEEVGSSVLPAGKRSRQEGKAAGAPEPETLCQKLGKFDHIYEQEGKL